MSRADWTVDEDGNERQTGNDFAGLYQVVSGAQTTDARRETDEGGNEVNGTWPTNHVSLK